MRRRVALALILLMATAAASPTITIKDLTPKFLAFYRAATARHLSPEARFALWQTDYGFAAVPPTPAGDAMARRLLDAAWPKYPGVMARIERGAAGIAPSPGATLARVTTLLDPGKPVRLTLLVYVGGLEPNAFTTAKNGVPTVAIPVEASPFDRGPAMAHEFTHAVQIAMGTMSGGWERTIGETVLAEGLAMRTAQALFPDRPAASFVEITPGWLARCNANRDRILADVRAALVSRRSDDVMRFTMGTGPSGVDREAYYAGWIIVDWWLHHGMTPARIARIPEAEAPARVGAAIDAMLAGK